MRGILSRDAEGMLDADEADEAYLLHLDRRAPARASDEAAEDAPTINEAQRVKEKYLALLRRLEYEQKAGRLGEVEEMERRVFALARANRDAWLNWPSRVASEVAAEVGADPHVVVTVLEKHVRRHIAELGAPESGSGAEPGGSSTGD